MNSDQEKLEFWAQLTSVSQTTKLPKEKNAALLKEFCRIFLPWLDDPAAVQQFFDAKLLPELKERIERDYKAGRMEIHLQPTLLLVWAEGAKLISALLNGEEVRPAFFGLPKLQPIWILENGKLQERLKVLKPRYDVLSIDLAGELLSDLYQLLQREPFPFRRCQVCGKVMVQAGRGKPKLYCSEACRSKGIPFAAKRTEHARDRRHQNRQEDLATVQRILQAWPEGERWQALHKMFPGKSRMALIRLVNKTKQANEINVGKEE